MARNFPNEITELKAKLAAERNPFWRRALRADLERLVGEASRADFHRRSSERMAAAAGNDRPWLATA